MADTDAPTDKVLITGPTGSGKTRHTAALLEAWVQTHGTDGVVVLEFAPEHRTRDGRILGRRMRRYMEIPEGIVYHEVQTHAPRAWASDEEGSIDLAHENMDSCARAIHAAPRSPRALFVNDATIAYHVPGADPGPLLARIREAGVAVVNALDPQGFDPEHPVTRQERRVLEALTQATKKIDRLPRQSVKENRQC